MKLYVCWGTFGGDWHHCHRAHHALTAAGHDPQVVRTYGYGALPDVLNPSRAPVRKLTGKSWVPVLELDDGEVIAGTDAIVDWAGPPAA